MRWKMDSVSSLPARVKRSPVIIIICNLYLKFAITNLRWIKYHFITIVIHTYVRISLETEILRYCCTERGKRKLHVTTINLIYVVGILIDRLLSLVQEKRKKRDNKVP